GNLAPKGAILKRSAADTKLFEHEGRAVVFTSLGDLAARIDDPALKVEAADILLLQNAGPHSAACMPEAGYLPIPKKLAQRGVKDMIRISDARMSGTAFGTIVLHVTPDAASGGPLGLVRNGDRIRLSVKNRRIELLVDEVELKKRASAAPAQTKIPERGYGKLFAEHILGADRRLVGDEVDAVDLGWPRLIAVIAEKLAGLAHRFSGLARRDLGDNALIARQRDLFPEFAHHLGGLAEADRRADLRRIAA